MDVKSAPAGPGSGDTAGPDAAGTGTGGTDAGGRSLSPSRASDFLTCPLLFRLRTIDRLPEPPSAAAVRGTLVHAVLDDLFELPAAERTRDQAVAAVEPTWQRLLEAEPELGELFAAAETEAGEAGEPLDPVAWLKEARTLVEAYFTLEDPRRIEPAERELLVESPLDDGLLLRGYVDRLDVAPTGEMRIVDYKTGSSPPPGFEHKALFQLRFYALVLWRLRGQVPRLLQLLYLGDGEVVRYEPDEADLLATERKVRALWAAIERARRKREFPARRSRLCGWCPHQALCPAFGGTPPPYPAAPEPTLATVGA